MASRSRKPQRPPRDPGSTTPLGGPPATADEPSPRTDEAAAQPDPRAAAPDAASAKADEEPAAQPDPRAAAPDATSANAEEPAAQPDPAAAPPDAASANAEEPAAQPDPRAAPPDPAPARPDRYARNRARDAEIREALEPLAPGERPRVVTIAALVAFAFVIANIVATLTVHDLSDQGNPTGVAAGTTAILVLAGGGMLARRYWAVLLFECILGLQIVILTLALTRVQKLWLGLAMTLAIGLLGWLFWKLIRPMARLQMPDGPGPSQPTR